MVGSAQGFFNSSGSMDLRDGLIASQSDAFGAISLVTAESSVRRERVESRANRSDQVQRRDDLPEGVSIEPPRL